jgi:hypothetical protein
MPNDQIRLETIQPQPIGQFSSRLTSQYLALGFEGERMGIGSVATIKPVGDEAGTGRDASAWTTPANSPGSISSPEKTGQKMLKLPWEVWVNH